MSKSKCLKEYLRVSAFLQIRVRVLVLLLTMQVANGCCTDGFSWRDSISTRSAKYLVCAIFDANWVVSKISMTVQKTKPSFLGRNGGLGWSESRWSEKLVGGMVSIGRSLGFGAGLLGCGIKRNLWAWRLGFGPGIGFGDRGSDRGSDSTCFNSVDSEPARFPLSIWEN